tara:strand:- start:25734 stop:26174 length:441 start_codon:yes stop_codon:yes gene_type:complete
MATPPPPPHAVLETVLYAEDLAAARGFYAGVLGLEAVDEMDELSLVLRIGSGQVVLIFDPRRSDAPGRSVPSHGHRNGCGHIALRIRPADLDAWGRRLTDHGVPIERTVDWSGGRGRSLYVRDPAGNSVELIDADIWPPGGNPGPA